jgi:sulfide:quinone oxidoreductase
VRRVVILGAGTAGTMMANKLRGRLSPADWTITVIDRDDEHVYQPGLLLLPFGTYRPEDIVRQRTPLLDAGIELRFAEIDRIDPAQKVVALTPSGPDRSTDAVRLSYDILIVATGCRIEPEATPGLAGVGWYEHMFDFYTLDGSTQLARALEDFQGGRVVVHVADMPIKCPVAPLEFAFLADAFFEKRGLRSKVEIEFVTPLDGAFTKPKASAVLGDMMSQRNIGVETDFSVASVDGEKKTITGFDGREIPFDLLVTVPLHFGSSAVAASGMGDHAEFLPTDKHTLAAVGHEGIFALGDVTDLPTSKAGSVAHFQAEVLVENVIRFIDERDLLPAFDGHSNCFIETGHGKAILIDFNYETEPLPGRFPLPGIGPFSLLEESQINHWGKLGFKWVYWNLLVRGKELPLDHRMVMAGKRA